MDWTHVGAALLSALLHAGWNAAVRAHPHPAQAMAGQMQMAALLLLPCLIWTGAPQASAWKWIALSTAINLLTVRALLRAYELTPFGVAYPVSRAVAVLLVVLLSQWTLGEALTGWTLGGVGLIAAALVVLAWGARSDRHLGARGLAWVAGAGVGIAVYVLADAQGVRASGSALAYCAVVSSANAIGMALTLGPGPAHLNGAEASGVGGRVRKLLSLHALRGTWRTAVPAGLASTVSYLLILWVWTQAAVAPASALRDTSAVFALLIAVFWFRERLTPTRALAVALSVLAVGLVRWGAMA